VPLKQSSWADLKIMLARMKCVLRGVGYSTTVSRPHKLVFLFPIQGISLQLQMKQLSVLQDGGLNLRTRFQIFCERNRKLTTTIRLSNAPNVQCQLSTLSATTLTWNAGVMKLHCPTSMLTSRVSLQ
jgi:hypothetical protein